MPDGINGIDQATNLDLELDGLVPWSGNPRKERSNEVIDALAKSIQRIGLINPITIRGKDVIAGVTRMLACRQLGHATIPAIVLPDETTDDECLQIALNENTARTAMTVIDQVAALRELARRGHISLDAAVAALGVERKQALRLFQYLALSPGAHAAWAHGKFGDDFAYVLSTLDHKQQTEVVRDLKKWTNWNSELPSAQRLQDHIDARTFDGAVARFSRQDFLDRGGKIIGDLLGHDRFDPPELAFDMQREIAQRLASGHPLGDGCAFATFFDTRNDSHRKHYIPLTEIPANERRGLAKTAGTIFIVTHIGEVKQIDGLVPLDELAAKRKAKADKEKAKARETAGMEPAAEPEEKEPPVPTKLLAFANFWAQSLAQLALLDNPRLAMAVYVARLLRQYQQDAATIPGMDEFLAGCPELMELRKMIDERIGEVGDHAAPVETLLKLKGSKLERLFCASMAASVQPYGYRDARLREIIAASKMRIEKAVYMATPEALKTLRKPQLLAIGAEHKVALTPDMKRDDMVDKLYAAIGGKPWQFAPLATEPVDEEPAEEDDND